MPHLLHLDSAASLKNSRSRELTATFADAWRRRGPEYSVTYRDLHREPLPHLADAVLHWPPQLRPAGAASVDAAVLATAEALQDDLIGELLGADVLLVGAPLYNYSVPSSLRRGSTTCTSPAGPRRSSMPRRSPWRDGPP